jgi:hypothetical protein
MAGLGFRRSGASCGALWYPCPYSTRHNYTGGVPNVRIFVLAPPGAAGNEMEQFRRMEMIDMVITTKWFSGRKSRSVNNFLQRPFFGLRWDFTPRGSRPDKMKPPPNAELSISPSGVYYDI